MRCLKSWLVIVIASLSCAVSPSVLAEDTFLNLRLDQLTLTLSDGQSTPTPPALPWTRPPSLASLPQVVVRDADEAFVYDGRLNRTHTADDVLVVHLRYANPPAEVSGLLSLPDAESRTPLVVPFHAKVTADVGTTKEDFYQGRARYYQMFLSLDLPGSAWFRYQRDRSMELAGKPGQLPSLPWWRRVTVNRTYDLLTGGRALSENLALDRQVQGGGEDATVPVDGIIGVTTRAYDWQPLVAGMSSKLDPLSRIIPVDQHAVFVRDFKSLVQVSDELKELGSPLSYLFEARSEDSHIVARYEKQMCLPLSQLSRMFGDQLIASVAFTGSDPYLRTGTDVAMLLEPRNTDALSLVLAAKLTRAAMEDPRCETLEGVIGETRYMGVRRPDRRICSYLAEVDHVLVVTNSLAQLRQLMRAAAGDVKSVDEAPEYTFFRDRHALGAQDVLVVLTDQTIRRWCSPRWRIAASRRIRAAAVLADLQARHLSELIEPVAEGRTLDPKTHLVDGGEFRLTRDGIQSTVYGNLAFLTPIRELEFDKVTKAEEIGYTTFRRGYERGWRVFDPIALAIDTDGSQIDADLTVIPLTLGTEYNDMIEWTSGSKIGVDAGDRHPATDLHVIFGINEKSRRLAQMSDFFRGMSRNGPRFNPLGWIGKHVEIYVDHDAGWLTEIEKSGTNASTALLFRTPLALTVDVGNPLLLTGFLTTLRAFSNVSAPNTTVWSQRKYEGKVYVCIEPNQEQLGASREEFGDLALYYATLPTGLVLSLREDVLKRAIERSVAREKAVKAEPPVERAEPKAWLGDNVCLHGNRNTFELLEGVFGESYANQLRERSYANLPILNEWHRMNPDRDPIALHDELWQIRLECPSGEAYVWNEQDQTMESRVFGSPLRPKFAKDGEPTLSSILDRLQGVNFGLTFEHDGLRARMRIQKRK